VTSNITEDTPPTSATKFSDSPHGILHPSAGRRVVMHSIVGFWRGDVSLGRAFWLWGVLGGGVVSLFTTVFTLALVTAGAPAGLAALVFALHLRGTWCCWSASGAAPGGLRWVAIRPRSRVW
jgi:hypothetical protein